MWSWWQSRTRLDDSTTGIEDEMPNVHRQEIIRTIREMQLKNIDEPEDELMDAAARGRGRGRAPAKRKPKSRSRSTGRKKKPKPRAKPRSRSGAKPKYRCTGNKCVRVRSETPCPVRGGVRNSRLLATTDDQRKAAPQPPTSPWTPVTKTTPLPPSSPAPRRVPTKLPPRRPLRPKNPYIGSKKPETSKTPPNQPKTRGFFVWRKNAPTATPQEMPSSDKAKPTRSGAKTANQEDADMVPTTSVATRSANAAPTSAKKSTSLPRTTRQSKNKRDGESASPAGAQQRAVSLPRNKRVPAKRGAPLRKTAAGKMGKVAKKKPPAANQKRGRK